MKFNENAAGSTVSLFTLFAVVLLGGFMLVACGYVVDIITQSLNNPALMALHASQFRYVVMANQLLMFHATPIVIIFGIIIGTIIASQKQFSDYSPLSTFAIAVTECVVTQLLVIALTAYVGAALDSAFYYGSQIGIGQGSAFWTLAQYIPMLFYGVMFIISLGSLIWFFTTCIRVSDNTQQYSPNTA
jgi:hypothetical protein